MTKPRFLLFSDLDSDWEDAARFANLVLKAGRSVWWAQESFRIRHGNGSFRECPPGSFLVPSQRATPTAAEDPFDVPDTRILEEARRRHVRIHAVELETGVTARSLRYPRIALFSDAGTPYAFATVLAKAGFDYYPLNAVDIRNDELKSFDVLMLPGGAHRGGELQGELMGETGRAKVKEFVHKGGAIWGSCGGCYNLIYVATSKRDYWKTVFKAKNARSFTINWTERPPFQSLELLNAEYWSKGMAGVGKLVMKNVNPNHQVLFGLPREFELAWQLGPFLDTAMGRVREASAPIQLLRLERFTPDWTSAESAYDHPNPKRALKEEEEDTYSARGVRDKVLGMVAGYYGKGKVCGSGGHPELGLDWLYERRGPAARIISNFIFWATSQETPVRVESRNDRTEDWPPILLGQDLHQKVVNKLALLDEAISALVSKQEPELPAFWNAEASFGLSAAEKWPILIRRVQELPNEIKRASVALQRENFKLYAIYSKLLTKHPTSGEHTTPHPIDAILSQVSQMLAKVVEDYTYKRAPEWEQDYGWQGVIALLDSAHTKILASTKNYNNPKAVGSDSPHSLMWGWYVGAVHDLINAKTVLNGRAILVSDLLAVTKVTKARL